MWRLFNEEEKENLKLKSYQLVCYQRELCWYIEGQAGVSVAVFQLRFANSSSIFTWLLTDYPIF